MKKLFILLFLGLFFSFNLKANTVLKIGATNVPHAEILEFAKPLLAKKGIDLQIILFQDYVLPNKALSEHEIDANYFQHLAFLQKETAQYGYKFTNLGSIHIEPMGVYSKKYKSLSEVKEGSTVLMSNSVSDISRNLIILEQMKLIKLKSGINKSVASIRDIAENPKHLNIINDIEPSMLPTMYLNGEGDLIFINTNYALSNKISPKSALYLEKHSKYYENILVVRSEDKNRSDLLTLLKVLKSKEVQNFIIKKYQGYVLPIK